MKTLDTVDHHLLALLEQDGRASITTLAAQLDVSRATVTDRVGRLRRRGIIRRFTIELAPGVAEEQIHSIMMMEMASNKEASVTRAVRQLPQVRQLHTTNGKWSLVAQLETRTLAEFDQTLRKIQHIPGVLNSETCLLLDRAK